MITAEKICFLRSGDPLFTEVDGPVEDRVPLGLFTVVLLEGDHLELLDLVVVVVH